MIRRPSSPMSALLVTCLAAGLAAGATMTGGCLDRCTPASYSDTAERAWPLQTPGLRQLPASTRAAVAVKDFGQLLEALEFGLEHVPEEAPKKAHNRSIAAVLEHLTGSPSDDDTTAGGLDADGSALLFDRGACRGAVIGVRDAEKLRAHLGGLEDSHGLSAEAAGSDDEETDRWRVRSGGSADFRVALGTSAVALEACGGKEKDGEDGENGGATPLAWFGHGHPEDEQEDSPETSEGRWLDRAQTRELLESMAGSSERALGVVDPAAWLASRGDREHASHLYERIARQTGLVGLRIRWSPAARKLNVDIHGLKNPGEPAVMGNVGTATGKLPPLGGLIEPGVLAVLHLSVDPPSIYKLLRSALPARDRRQLDAFWTQLEEKAQIIGPDALLELWTGHAVVVAYGLDSGALQSPGPVLARQLASLQATREAVLLPITDREKVERTLDILTQLSQGRLSRQLVRDTVQYAWMSQSGLMRGAMILSDEHLTIVDGGTAFDRAKAYERRGRPLGEQARQMGISPLLEDPKTSGIYLDIGTLANLLSENGHARTAAWLMPFQSLVLTTSGADEADLSRLELKVEEP